MTGVYQRIYVAGPYSAPTLAEREQNVATAAMLAVACMERGHDVHCPHTATHQLELMRPFDYERWMRLDFGIIEHWATAILYFKASRGADRELARAEKLGLRIYRSIGEVEDATEARHPRPSRLEAVRSAAEELLYAIDTLREGGMLAAGVLNREERLRAAVKGARVEP